MYTPIFFCTRLISVTCLLKKTRNTSNTYFAYRTRFFCTVGNVGQAVGRRAVGRLERTRREVRFVQRSSRRCGGGVPRAERLRRDRIAADVAVGRAGTSRGGQHAVGRSPPAGADGRRGPDDGGSTVRRPPKRLRGGRRTVGDPSVRRARASGRPRGRRFAGVVGQHQVPTSEADGLWRRRRR